MSRTKVSFFKNGLTAAFEDGQQLPQLQESWFVLYLQFIAAAGFDPTEIDFFMPNARSVKVFRLEDGSFLWRPCR